MAESHDAGNWQVSRHFGKSLLNFVGSRSLSFESEYATFTAPAAAFLLFNRNRGIRKLLGKFQRKLTVLYMTPNSLLYFFLRRCVGVPLEPDVQVEPRT